ncbi:MAG: M48 family metallopeptidase [Pseudomonadota bacterium]
MPETTALQPLRFEYEQFLFDDLSRHPDVQSQQSAEEQEQYFNLHKRHLLGTAVRITNNLFPELQKIYHECLEHLKVDVDGHLYIYQAPEYNAKVYAHDRRFDILLTSALVKEFTPSEIAFVIGHELGHVLFEHHDIPATHLLYNKETSISKELAKRLFQWSRAAEISADRVGFLACGDLTSAANAFFKLASGVHLENGHQVVSALRSQFEEILHLTDELNKSNIGYYSTHPLIPIRFRSLELVSLDILNLRSTGQTPKLKDLNEINRQVQSVLSKTEPVNIKSDGGAPANVRRIETQQVDILFLCALCVAVSDGELSEHEAACLKNIAAQPGADLQVQDIVEECHQDYLAFIEKALAEVEQINLSADECRLILAECLSMTGRHLNTHEREVLQRISTALGVPDYWLDDLLMEID